MPWIICLSVGIICLIAGLIIQYKRLSPKVNERIELNEEVRQKNIEIYSINQKLNDDCIDLKKDKEVLNSQKDSLLEEISNLKTNLFLMNTQAEATAETYYKDQMNIAKLKIDKETQDLQNQYSAKNRVLEDKYNQRVSVLEQTHQAKISDLEQQYLNKISELETELNQKTEKYFSDIEEMEKQQKDLRSQVEAAVAAAKRAEEIRNENNFYKIQLSNEDINDIKLLRQVGKQLNNPEVMNKIIWKCYYEKPTTDLIGRVVGQKTRTGIYKITEIATQKCYVGQSLNIADRWRQHIKRGIGAEAPTRNKLYPIMLSVGVENFTFELIEDCEKERLDEREKFWQEYFEARTFGYSIK